MWEAFLGIQYAQPPLKSLRYRAPKHLNTNWTEPKNATEFGFQCVGYGVSILYCTTSRIFQEADVP